MKPSCLDKPSVHAGIGLTAGPLLRCVDIDEDAPELARVVGVRGRHSEHNVAEQSHRKDNSRACPAPRRVRAVSDSHPRLLQSAGPRFDGELTSAVRRCEPEPARGHRIGNPPGQSNAFDQIERNRG
jgi:hypothetical protein